MKRFAVTTMLLLLAAGYATANTWTTLDYPGATWTEAYGISGNSVVGVYGTGAITPYDGHGFLFDGTNYTALDYPEAASTHAYGISDNNIVGEYFDSLQNEHGFLYNKISNIWTALDYPGAMATGCTGISGSNIIGVYDDISGFHSFTYDMTSNTWTTLDYPEGTWTSAFGIDGNSVVGNYDDSSYNNKSFLYNGTSWTTLDTPAGAYSVEARGISDNNIVGYYSDYYGNYGFIYNRTMWTILEYPGAWMTFAEDISGNRVVGRYFDNSVNAHYEHGFVCNISDTPTTPIECKMKITPQAINRKSSQPRIQAVIRLPDSISPKDIDTGELLVLSPGSIKAVRQSLSAGNGITAEFDKDALMAATSNGNIEIKVTGKLTSGQYFYAADTVKIIH